MTALPDGLVSELDDVVYNGLLQRQKPTVTGLLEGRDYTLSYQGDAVNATEAGITVTVSGAGNYAGSSVTRTYRITPRSINPETDTGKACSVSVTPAVIPYTGEVQSPVVLVRDGQRVLTSGTDYTLTYPDNAVNAGLYTITVSGKGNYADTRTVSFRISAAASSGGLEVTVSAPTAYIYDGQAKTPGITVVSKDHKETLTEGTDFTVTYANNVHAGRATVSVSGKGNYAGSFGSADFLIGPAELAGVSRPGSGAITYNGKEQTPAVTVTAKDTSLTPTENTDYNVIYQNNIGAGTAAVTVTGKGDYTGTVTTSFAISPAVLTVTPDAGQGKTYGEAEPDSYGYTHDGPAELAFAGALARKPGEDAGDYAFSLGTLRETSGNYTLTLAEDAPKFTVQPKDLSGDGITGQTDLEVGYTGAAFDRAVTTRYDAPALGSLLLTADDYTLTFDPASPGDVGAYTVTVEGKGNYQGSYEFRLTISDALLGVTMTKDAEIYDGTDWAAGMTDRLTAFFDGEEVELADAKVTYRNAQGSEVDEIVDAGDYTVEVKVENFDAVTLPFHVQPADISGAAFDALDGQIYSGQALTPAPAADGLTEDADYTLTWRDNVDAGTGYVDITGLGNYTGVKTLSFAIAPRALTEEDVGELTDQVYTGGAQALKPAVTVDGIALTEGRDYTLTFAGDTVNAAEAGITVTITAAGNYQGAVERSYAITPKTLEDTWLTASPDTLTYTGSPLTPMILVQDGSVALTEGRDYTLTWRDNVEQGTGCADVTGKGNYQGTASVSFEIAASAASLSVRASETSHVYDGADHAPVLTVLDGVLPLIPDTDYTASYTFNGQDMGQYAPDSEMVDAGIYLITVSGMGNYDGAEGAVSFRILPATLTMGAVGEQDYTGSPVTPLPTVTRTGDTAPLALNVDYVLSYNNNVAMGEQTAAVTATGLGNYAGSAATQSFTITGARTLFAVTYDGNGHTAGDPPVDSQKYLAGGSFTVMGSNRIQRRGGAFLGWTTTAVTTLVTSAAEQSALPLLSPGDRLSMTRNGLTLYAVWGQDANLNGRPDYAETLTITAAASGGGSISPEGRKVVDWGEAQVRYTMTPDDGYYLSRLTVDGVLVDLSTLTQQNGSYIYTFRDLNADHSIFASFTSGVSDGVTLDQDTVTYNGSDWAQNMADRLSAVYDGVKVPLRAEDLTYRNAAGEPVERMADAGEYTIVVNVPGRDAVELPFRILPAALTMAPVADQNYTGKPVTPLPSVLRAGDGAPLTVDVDYVLSYENNVALGRNTACVTATGLGNYAGSVAKQFFTIASFGGGGGGGGGSIVIVEPSGDPTLEDLKRSGIDKWLIIDDHAAYLQGRGDGDFHPNDSLTRAEAAMVIYRLLKDPKVTVTVHFDDVAPDAWYAVAVETLASLGILKGTGNGRFEPERAVTRSEFAVIAARLATPVPVGEVRDYTDISADQWFYPEVQLATHYGWLAGYPDSSFGPYRDISRAELAKVINRMTGRIPDAKRIDSGDGVVFGDVPKTHWAYYEIVEAATGHDFDRVNRVETWDLP